MLFHQRLDYSPPSSTQRLYLRIPMSSTLWTIIESRSFNSESVERPSTAAPLRSAVEPHSAAPLRSAAFPSRILKQDDTLSVVFTGVDTSCLLQAGIPMEYRITWRTVPDPQDPNPENLVCIPLESPVTFTFAYGSSTLLSLGIGGVDLILHFDRSTRILSTSWFVPPLITSWTLALPKRIMTRLLKGIWQPLIDEMQAQSQVILGQPLFDEPDEKLERTPGGPGRAPPVQRDCGLWAAMSSLFCCRNDE